MKLIKSRNAETELLGHIIILGITILGIITIAIYGVPSILDLQTLANLRNAEQTLAVLDSHASRTVLGNSPTQVTEMELGGGSLTVIPNSSSPSYIMINSTAFNFTVPMGKVEYQLGDRRVAFEGGGVWSNYPSGTVMLSRPEFNYNGWTLTLPVFNISGSASVGGKGTAMVSVKKNPPVVVFPNTANASWVNRTNPVNFTVVGKVYVNIKSDFYDGWANYVESVSSVKVVSEDPKNHTASVMLTVYPPYIGKMDYYITQPIVIRGLDPSNSTPMGNFSFKIYTQGMNKWDLRARSGNRSLMFYISHLNETPDNYPQLTIGYNESGGSGIGETWGTYTYTVQTDEGGQYIYVDLLNKSINLNYYNGNPPVGADNSNSCSPYGGKISGSPTQASSWLPDVNVTLTNANGTQSLYNITQHYIERMAQMAQNSDITLYQCVPSGKKLPSAGSSMNIDYFAPGGLTFMDVTDNKADVVIS